jgi:hypothetical protein
MKSVTIQAGKYYLGDPCYSLQDSWGDVLKQTGCFKKLPIAEIDGHQVLGFKTAYGDGIYQSNTGRAFCVDAGMIGLVPIELAEEENPFSTIVIEFHEPTLCTNKNGLMQFGLIKIDTRR